MSKTKWQKKHCPYIDVHCPHLELDKGTQLAAIQKGLGPQLLCNFGENTVYLESEVFGRMHTPLRTELCLEKRSKKQDDNDE